MDILSVNCLMQQHVIREWSFHWVCVKQRVRRLSLHYSGVYSSVRRCQRWAVWMGVPVPPFPLLKGQWGRTFPGLRLCLGVVGFEEERDS